MDENIKFIDERITNGGLNHIRTCVRVEPDPEKRKENRRQFERALEAMYESVYGGSFTVELKGLKKDCIKVQSEDEPA